MLRSNEFKLLNIKFDNLSSLETLEKIKYIINNGVKSYIVTGNAYHIIVLEKDNEFKEVYKNAALVLADGTSLVLVSKILLRPLKERVAGSDLFEEICKIAWQKSKRIFILGGTNNSEKIAISKLKKKYKNIIVSAHNPPFGFESDNLETKKIINMINDFNSDILFVCVGSPKSEKWIYKNFNSLDIILACPLGAALDFFAGTKKRAPKWIQEIGFEWLYRLMQEPRRLWKRYLIGNLIFSGIVIKEFFRFFLKK